ncbi:hypothetical protein [Pseudomonas fortuita]|uniref:hypothetical protein n=1 Tax=Pseudomonas fortuita TaxID=3233375 RepID=UPI003DA100C3
MSLVDIFSKRQKRLRGEISDVYQYDHLPEPLRIQIVHVMLEMLGKPGEYVQGDPWSSCAKRSHVNTVFSPLLDLDLAGGTASVMSLLTSSYQ